MGRRNDQRYVRVATRYGLDDLMVRQDIGDYGRDADRDTFDHSYLFMDERGQGQ